MCTTSAAGRWILKGLGMEFSGNCSCGLAYFGDAVICQGALSKESPKSNAQIGLAIFLRQSLK